MPDNDYGNRKIAEKLAQAGYASGIRYRQKHPSYSRKRTTSKKTSKSTRRKGASRKGKGKRRTRRSIGVIGAGGTNSRVNRTARAVKRRATKYARAFKRMGFDVPGAPRKRRVSGGEARAGIAELEALMHDDL